MLAPSVRLRLGLVLIGLAGLAACHGSSSSNNQTNNPNGPTMPAASISLNPAGPVQIGSSAQSGVTVAVTIANVTSWSAMSDSSFVTITGGSSGTANGTITYSVSANPGPGTRTAHINIAGSGATATLEVDQAAPPAASLSWATASPVSLTADAQSSSASINATLNWSVASDQSFLTFSGPTTGSTSGSVNYSVTANGGAARTAHLTATASSVPNAVLTVNQAGLTAAFTFSATASVTGGDCAVKPSPSGSPVPAQIFCKFDPASSSPASAITSYKFTLVEEGNETLGTGTSVSTPLTSPLTACGFGSNTATPVTIRLSVSSATTTVTVDKTVVLVKSGVC